MLHNEFIIADLVFRDCARGRPDEQDFYEAFGKASVVRPALDHALAAVRAALRRLGKEARHLHVGSRAHTAARSA
jgi:hypothetical protein